MIFVLLNEKSEIREAMKVIICNMLERVVNLTPDQIQEQNDHQYGNVALLIEGKVSDEQLEQITNAIHERLNIDIHLVGA